MRMLIGSILKMPLGITDPQLVAADFFKKLNLITRIIEYTKYNSYPYKYIKNLIGEQEHQHLFFKYKLHQNYYDFILDNDTNWSSSRYQRALRRD